MIRVPRGYFANLNIKQYREYLKLLPPLKDKKARLATMLAFTLAAMSFFGIFAINPTLSTIAELKRQYADLEFVHQKLVIKAQALNALQQKYQTISTDLPIVYEAMPQTPEIPRFVGQVNALASRTNLNLRSLRTFGVEITPGKKPKPRGAFSFAFTLEADGGYEDILNLVHDLSRINRLVSIEIVSIVKDSKSGLLILNLRGRQYFKP